MTTYERSDTIEAMQWNGYEKLLAVVGRPGKSAELIVAWIKDNGGEARYEPGYRIPEGFGAREPAKIVVRTRGGWFKVKPGDYIVMGTELLEDTEKPWSTGPHMTRPFFRKHPDEFKTEGWTKK